MGKFLFSFLIITSFVNGFAQQYNFVDYSVESGLAQSQVRSICQDNDGYIWVGTLGGVSKFDGIHFKNFSTADGLLNNQVNCIFKDKQGRIWLGTNGGVSVYDGKRFKNLIFKESIRKNFVLSITEDKNGVMWFATDGGGLVYYNNKILNYFKLPNGKKSNYIRSIVCDKLNNKWLATRNGMFKIDTAFNVNDTLANVNATKLYITQNQDIWCSTFGNGVFKITKDSLINFKQNNGLISNHIRDFVKRSDGSFWFVAKTGISKYFNKKFKNFKTKDGLPNENIKCVSEDIEGNLFFGSDGGGLIKFSNEKFISYTVNDGLPNNIIMSILEDANHHLWFSTYGNGVCKKVGKKFIHYTEKDGLGNNIVWCSLLAKNNNIWFGTSNGISVYNGIKFKTYNQKNGLNAKTIYALSEDKKGNIWIGTKDGLSVLYIKKDSIYNYDEIAGISRNIRHIFHEDNKAIWFCSSDGLFRYDIKKHTAKKFGSTNGLPDNSVMTITKDNYNRLWVGTKNGLAIYENGVFKTVQLPDNYASNNINFLQLDTANNLWIGTNYGLYQLNILAKNTFTSTDFIRYSNLDGLKSLECNQNAVFIDTSNNLWFGTSKGLMRHTLDKKNKKAVVPKVKLTGIRLFFEYQDWKKYSKEMKDNTNIPQKLVLRYNKNHLTFDFIGIYHTNPDKVKYRFKLDGFDNTWQPITKATFVTYSNIPPGDFTFELSATTDLKRWTTPIVFKFKIKSPFWLTWWFYASCIIALFFIIWLIIVNREKNAKRKRNTQLMIDKSKMLSLEQQALNASMNRHFIFNSLNSIQYYINRQDRLSANKYLTNFAKLIRKNLDSSLENEIYIDEEIERIDLYLKLEQMRFQNKFNYKIKIDNDIEPQTIKIPSMILQPFIENSIWHGILPSDKVGNIVVDVRKKENKIVIDVMDDGIGIEKSMALKKDKEQHHISKGMEITKSRINLASKISNKNFIIDGPNQIFDENNKIIGTKVSIILSLF